MRLYPLSQSEGLGPPRSPPSPASAPASAQLSRARTEHGVFHGAVSPLRYQDSSARPVSPKAWEGDWPALVSALPFAPSSLVGAWATIAPQGARVLAFNLTCFIPEVSIQDFEAHDRSPMRPSDSLSVCLRSDPKTEKSPLMCSFRAASPEVPVLGTGIYGKLRCLGETASARNARV